MAVDVDPDRRDDPSAVAGRAADVAAGDVLRALAEPVRLRIVERLAAEQLCACHLTEDLGLSQPLVSHHLRVLRDAGLIEGERHRYWTYYRLLPGGLADAAQLLGHLARAAHTPITELPRRPCC